MKLMSETLTARYLGIILLASGIFNLVRNVVPFWACLGVMLLGMAAIFWSNTEAAKRKKTQSG